MIPNSHCTPIRSVWWISVARTTAAMTTTSWHHIIIPWRTFPMNWTPCLWIKYVNVSLISTWSNTPGSSADNRWTETCSGVSMKTCCRKISSSQNSTLPSSWDLFEVGGPDSADLATHLQIYGASVTPTFYTVEGARSNAQRKEALQEHITSACDLNWSLRVAKHFLLVGQDPKFWVLLDFSGLDITSLITCNTRKQIAPHSSALQRARKEGQWPCSRNLYLCMDRSRHRSGFEWKLSFYKRNPLHLLFFSLSDNSKQQMSVQRVWNEDLSHHCVFVACVSIRGREHDLEMPDEAFRRIGSFVHIFVLWPEAYFLHTVVTTNDGY